MPIDFTYGIVLFFVFFIRLEPPTTPTKDQSKTLKCTSYSPKFKSKNLFHETSQTDISIHSGKMQSIVIDFSVQLGNNSYSPHGCLEVEVNYSSSY